MCDLDQCSSLLNVSDCTLKIMTQNIRSVNHNISGYMTILHRTAVEWDFLVLTECWLSRTPNIPTIDGYYHNSTFLNQTQNEGVIVYIKNNLTALVSEPPFMDANCLTINIKNHTLLICIYRPPSQTNLTNFFDSLNNLLISSSSYQNIIICGDINIDIHDNNSDRNSCNYLNLLAFHGLLPAHTLPTHGNTCLDHFIVKTKSKGNILVAQSTLTDHYTVMLSLTLGYKNNKASATYKRVDAAGLTNSINEIDFSCIYNESDPNIAVMVLINLISNAIKSNTRIFTPSKRKKILKPWITPGLLKCMKNRDNLHKKFKNQPQNSILKVTYLRYRNFCNNILKQVKQNYERDEIKKAGSNNRKLWKVINNVTNRLKPKNTATELITQTQSLNDINNFFANIGKSLAEKITVHPVPPTSPTLPNLSPSQSMVLLQTDHSEIETIILNLKRNCAVGWDDISSDLLIEHRNILVPPITHICNLCLSSGIFPKPFKKSLITPIHKSGDKSLINNYRPISVLTALSKVLERLMNHRLVNFLENNNLLSTTQYGFREAKSTADAVSELTNYVVNNLDKHNKTIAIFLDLKKAFDTVSIPLLINKLEHLGIRDIQLQLFKDYLTNRTQCVKIDNAISDELPVLYGVPQGSILGPTLFLVYINSLCQLSLQNGKLLAFADDTVLLFSTKSWCDTYSSAQIGLNRVTSWLRENVLTLNTDKSNYISFSITNSNRDLLSSFCITAHSCTLNNVNCTCPDLQQVDSYKYLGIQIDYKLNFQQHINMVSGRVRKLIYVFKTLRHIISDFHTLKSIYFSLCQSIILYCISSWGGANKTNMIKLERAQRAILKVMSFLPFRFPTTDLYTKTKVLTVRKLFVLYTFLKQHRELSYNTSLISNKRKNTCPIQAVSSSFAQRFYLFLGPFLYNKIDNKLHIYSLTKFECKKKMTLWLQGLDYNDTEDLITVTP